MWIYAIKKDEKYYEGKTANMLMLYQTKESAERANLQNDVRGVITQCWLAEPRADDHQK